MGKDKWALPVPPYLVKAAALVLEGFDFFPVSRDQLTMLLEGNTCDSSAVLEAYGIQPTPFNEQSLACLHQSLARVEAARALLADACCEMIVLTLSHEGAVLISREAATHIPLPELETRRSAAARMPSGCTPACSRAERGWGGPPYSPEGFAATSLAEGTISISSSPMTKNAMMALIPTRWLPAA